MIQTSMDPAGVGSLEVQSSLPGRCGWGPRSLDISHAGLDGKSHLSMGDSIAFHCYDSRRGFFRVLETWNDQGRMILIIYTYIYIYKCWCLFILQDILPCSLGLLGAIESWGFQERQNTHWNWHFSGHEMWLHTHMSSVYFDPQLW